MNYLELAKEHTATLDPDADCAEYDIHLAAIGILMQVLTLALFLSFGVVGLKKAAVSAMRGDFRDKATALQARAAPRLAGIASTPRSAARRAFSRFKNGNSSASPNDDLAVTNPMSAANAHDHL